MTLTDCTTTYLDSLWKRPATQRTYRTALSRLQDFLEEKLNRPAAMSDLYDEMLVDFDIWLGKQGRKDGTHGTYAAAILSWLNNALLRKSVPEGVSIERMRALWKDAQQRSGHHSRPAQEFMDMPRLVAHLDNVTYVEGIKGRIKYLAGLRNRAFMWFIYATGARQGTARSLKIKQVRNPDGSIKRVIEGARGKGNKEGILVIDEERARRAIKEYLEARTDTSEWLFISHDRDMGKPICGVTAWKFVHDAAKELGLDFSPHDARHFWAIFRINAGMPLEVVQKLLWHSSPVTTANVYATVKNETQLEWIGKTSLPNPIMSTSVN